MIIIIHNDNDDHGDHDHDGGHGDDYDGSHGDDANALESEASIELSSL